MASRKRDSYDWVLLLLLLLGVRVPPGLGGPADTGSTASMPSRGTSPDEGMGRSSGSDSTQPSDTSGVTNKGPNVDPRLNPTGGSPDKSKGMQPPGAMPAMPTYMPPGMTNIANLINPKAPTGGVLIAPNTYYLPGLSLTGQAMGGPGEGPYSPSITTKYGNNVYTNFNPALLVAMMGTVADKGSPVIEMMQKQPVPMGAMPPMMMKSGSEFPLPMLATGKPSQLSPAEMLLQMLMGGPLQIPTPSAVVPPMAQKIPMPPMMQSGSTMVPNPLPKNPSPLDMLTSGALNIWSDITAFTKQALAAIPGIPAPVARPVIEVGV